MMLAAGGQGYDAQLVNLLLDLAARSGTFSKVTFFTTTLTQLAVLGYYPNIPGWQHHGVQLMLSDDSGDMQLDIEGTPGARVLVLEMMADGLLWSLRNSGVDLNDVHSMQEYEFESVAPEWIADYILDQKGTTYQDANCQEYALNLMNRIRTHGRGLSASEPLVSTKPEVTLRFKALLVLAGLVAAAFVALQWLLIWRVTMQFRHADGGFMTKLYSTAKEVASDLRMLEAWAAKIVGEGPACNIRRAIVLVIMSQSSPVFWYVVVTEVRKRTKVAPEPLLEDATVE